MSPAEDNGSSADSRQMSSLLRTLAWTIILALGSLAAASGDTSKPVAAADLVGLTREDVVALRGKPSGERARADGSVLLVYPDGTKIELRDGRVFAATGAGAAQIVGADGTRYVPGADGNIQRPVVMVGSTDAAAEGPKPEVSAPSADGEAAADDDADLPPGATAPPSIAAVDAALAERLADPDDADTDDAGTFDDEESEEAPAGLRIVAFLVGTIIRFGLVVLVLRLALHFVGVPFFWPDLLKVALLYLAVHEVLSGLGELGGWWEFVPLFRIDEVISFIVLACSLTWFKIAGSGITALKVAVATKVVVFGLMLVVGLLVTLAMSALM